MNNPLYNELTDLEYVVVTDLELEYPPDTVVVYLKNNTEQDVRMVIEFLDPAIQAQFENQNPSMTTEDGGETTLCLSVSEEEEEEPNPCEGAIPFISIENDLHYGDDDYNVEWIIYIDDEEVGTTTCWEENTEYAEDLINADGRFSAEYVGNEEEEYLKITNNSSSTLYTLKLVPTLLPPEENFKQHIDTSNNPTYNYDMDTGIITACLSPSEFFSCEGAESSVKYSLATRPDLNVEKYFTIKIDGVELGLEESTPPWVSVELVNENVVALPGYEMSPVIRLTNTDSIEHRFEFISNVGDQMLMFMSENSSINQVSFDRFTFCLGAGEAVESFNCDGATNTSGCIQIEGLWDLEVNGEIVLTDVDVYDIEDYIYNSESPLAPAEDPCCDEGFYRSISLSGINYDHVRFGDTIYIPIALTPDGPSITSPITISEESVDWYALGHNVSDQLNQQLIPYGLTSSWTNNFKEFGVTYYKYVQDKKDLIEFYVLDEENTFSSEEIPRGLPPVSCFQPT